LVVCTHWTLPKITQPTNYYDSQATLATTQNQFEIMLFILEGLENWDWKGIE